MLRLFVLMWAKLVRAYVGLTSRGIELIATGRIIFFNNGLSIKFLSGLRFLFRATVSY